MEGILGVGAGQRKLHHGFGHAIAHLKLVQYEVQCEAQLDGHESVLCFGRGQAKELPDVLGAGEVHAIALWPIPLKALNEEEDVGHGDDGARGHQGATQQLLLEGCV